MISLHPTPASLRSASPPHCNGEGIEGRGYLKIHSDCFNLSIGVYYSALPTDRKFTLIMTRTTILALQPPDPQITIRPVRYADLDALQRHCWPERDAESVYRFIARIRKTATDGRGLGAVVIGPDHEAVGYGQFVLWPRCGEISDLIVAPPYRSNGLGSALIQYLVRAAQEMHSPCVDIGAALSNTGAVALYRRLGFRDSYTQIFNLGHGDEEVLYLRLKFES